MHLVDPERGFLGTSGIVGQGIPHATGAAYAAQIRKQGPGRPVASSATAPPSRARSHESLNIASLWKLPIVYVMENNNYNVVTRSEQEDANAAAGEPLAVKAEGLQHAGRDRRRRRPARGLRDRRRGGRRARAPATGRRSSSRRSTASSPTATSSPRPACRCTTPSTRRSRVRQPRGVRGRAARRPRAALPRPADRATARSTRPRADAIAASVRDEMEAAVQFAWESPFPEPEAGPVNTTSTPRRATTMAHELPYIAAIKRGDPARDGARPDRPLLRPEHRDDRRRPVPAGVRRATACASRRSPRPPRSAWRSARARRLPPGRRALHGRVHARRDGPGRQRGQPLPLHERRPGQGAARAEGRLRLHGRLGRPAHRLDLRDVHGRPGPEGRAALDGGRREGPDGDARSATTTRSATSTTTC